MVFEKKRHASLEYIILAVGFVLLVVIVIAVASGLTKGGEESSESRKAEAYCAALIQKECGQDRDLDGTADYRDPDGAGPLTAADCKWDAALKRCIGS